MTVCTSVQICLLQASHFLAQASHCSSNRDLAASQLLLQLIQNAIALNNVHLDQPPLKHPLLEISQGYTRVTHG